jgi:hypothetical protein
MSANPILTAYDTYHIPFVEQYKWKSKHIQRTLPQKNKNAGENPLWVTSSPALFVSELLSGAVGEFGQRGRCPYKQPIVEGTSACFVCLLLDLSTGSAKASLTRLPDRLQA